MGKTSTSFKPGEKRVVRKTGSKNKKTLLKESFGVQSWDQLKDFIEGRGLAKLTNDMQRLPIKEYWKVYIAIAEYVKPKLQRTTIAGDSDNPLKGEIKIIHVQAAAPLATDEAEVVT